MSVYRFYAPSFKIKLNNRTMTLQELKDGPSLEKDNSAGFPHGRGVLSLDESAVGPNLYKLPRDAKLNPLGAGNIDDPTRVMN